MPGKGLETVGRLQWQEAMGVCTGALVSTAPAVSLKVRVMGDIEGPQGEPSHSGSLVVFGQANPQE